MVGSCGYYYAEGLLIITYRVLFGPSLKHQNLRHQVTASLELEPFVRRFVAGSMGMMSRARWRSTTTPSCPSAKYDCVVVKKQEFLVLIYTLTKLQALERQGLDVVRCFESNSSCSSKSWETFNQKINTSEGRFWPDFSFPILTTTANYWSSKSPPLLLCQESLQMGFTRTEHSRHGMTLMDY